MKTRAVCDHLRRFGLQTAVCVSLVGLSGCQSSPDKTWRIIRRDGLITYLDTEHHPDRLSTRYLAEPNPYKKPHRNDGRRRVVEHPEETRYLAVRRAQRVKVEEEFTLQTSQRQAPVTRQRRVYPPTGETRVSGPKTAPQRSTAQSQLQPAPSQAPASPQTPLRDLPYGTPVAGRPGMVNSPYATRQQLVDVTGMATGEVVRDPYSGKLFRVPPPSSQADGASKAGEKQPVAEPSAGTR